MSEIRDMTLCLKKSNTDDEFGVVCETDDVDCGRFEESKTKRQSNVYTAHPCLRRSGRGVSGAESFSKWRVPSFQEEEGGASQPTSDFFPLPWNPPFFRRSL